MNSVARVALLGGFVLAYGAFSVWTIRRLLSPSSGAQRPFVRRYGLLGWGGGFWVWMTIDHALEAHTSGIKLWEDVLMYAYILLPIALWGGYVVGWAMQSFLGWFSGRDVE